MDCGVPFCHTGCPLNNLIPTGTTGVQRALGERDPAAARDNNFPEFTGRICPAPCETACVLAITEPAVSIKQIERGIVDHAWDEG